MSSFLLRTTKLAARQCPPASIKISKTFSTTRVLALKETDRHNPDQASDNERHKQDQLQKQREGKGHWKPELASDSEEAVAADRSHQGETIDEMQKKTADDAEKKHKHGTSQNPGF